MNDKVSYEKEVNDALQKHMKTLEEAHRNREADWRELAIKWKKYEEDAIVENHRWVCTMRMKYTGMRSSSKTVPAEAGTAGACLPSPSLYR